MAENEDQELLYREYVRLAEAGNTYVRDALSDVRLLGGVGAVLAWDPVVRYLDLDAKLDQPVTPIGFTTLLLVVMFLLFFNLFKQSIFFFYLARMRRLEERLNRQLAADGEPVFALAQAWPGWQRRVHDPIAAATFLIFYSILIAFPAAIMSLQGFGAWVPAYVGLALFLVALHAGAVWHITRALRRS